MGQDDVEEEGEGGRKVRRDKDISMIRQLRCHTQLPDTNKMLL